MFVDLAQEHLVPIGLTFEALLVYTHVLGLRWIYAIFFFIMVINSSFFGWNIINNLFVFKILFYNLNGRDISSILVINTSIQ
jgi:hypothetical protein